MIWLKLDRDRLPSLAEKCSLWVQNLLQQYSSYPYEISKRMLQSPGKNELCRKEHHSHLQSKSRFSPLIQIVSQVSIDIFQSYLSPTQHRDQRKSLSSLVLLLCSSLKMKTNHTECSSSYFKVSSPFHFLKVPIFLFRSMRQLHYTRRQCSQPFHTILKRRPSLLKFSQTRITPTF